MLERNTVFKNGINEGFGFCSGLDYQRQHSADPLRLAPNDTYAEIDVL